MMRSLMNSSKNVLSRHYYSQSFHRQQLIAAPSKPRAHKTLSTVCHHEQFHQRQNLLVGVSVMQHHHFPTTSSRIQIMPSQHYRTFSSSSSFFQQSSFSTKEKQTALIPSSFPQYYYWNNNNNHNNNLVLGLGSLSQRRRTLVSTINTTTTIRWPHQHTVIRSMMSDSGGSSNKPGNESNEIGSTPTNKKQDESSKKADEETTTTAGGGDNKSGESLDPMAFLVGTREQLKKVQSGNFGDMVATGSIVVLLAAILLSPFVTSHMRTSDSTYEDLFTDDQVLDLSKIIQHDFLDKLSTDDNENGDKGAVEFVLADVLSSQALQQQAIKFVVHILQSAEVKKAAQALLNELWNDLIKDPETTAQVIFLLNVAIENEDIRLAVKKLVLDIVEDDEVMNELKHLLRKLGRDQEVRVLPFRTILDHFFIDFHFFKYFDNKRHLISLSILSLRLFAL